MHESDREFASQIMEETTKKFLSDPEFHARAVLSTHVCKWICTAAGVEPTNHEMNFMQQAAAVGVLMASIEIGDLVTESFSEKIAGQMLEMALRHETVRIAAEEGRSGDLARELFGDRYQPREGNE